MKRLSRFAQYLRDRMFAKRFELDERNYMAGTLLATSEYVTIEDRALAYEMERDLKRQVRWLNRHCSKKQ